MIAISNFLFELPSLKLFLICSYVFNNFSLVVLESTPKLGENFGETCLPPKKLL